MTYNFFYLLTCTTFFALILSHQALAHKSCETALLNKGLSTEQKNTSTPKEQKFSNRVPMPTISPKLKKGANAAWDTGQGFRAVTVIQKYEDGSAQIQYKSFNELKRMIVQTNNLHVSLGTQGIATKTPAAWDTGQGLRAVTVIQEYKGGLVQIQYKNFNELKRMIVKKNNLHVSLGTQGIATKTPATWDTGQGLRAVTVIQEYKGGFVQIQYKNFNELKRMIVKKSRISLSSAPSTDRLIGKKILLETTEGWIPFEVTKKRNQLVFQPLTKEGKKLQLDEARLNDFNYQVERSAEHGSKAGQKAKLSPALAEKNGAFADVISDFGNDMVLLSIKGQPVLKPTSEVGFFLTQLKRHQALTLNPGDAVFFKSNEGEAFGLVQELWSNQDVLVKWKDGTESYVQADTLHRGMTQKEFEIEFPLGQGLIINSQKSQETLPQDTTANSQSIVNIEKVYEGWAVVTNKDNPMTEAIETKKIRPLAAFEGLKMGDEIYNGKDFGELLAITRKGQQALVRFYNDKGQVFDTLVPLKDIGYKIQQSKGQFSIVTTNFRKLQKIWWRFTGSRIGSLKGRQLRLAEKESFEIEDIDAYRCELNIEDSNSIFNFGTRLIVFTASVQERVNHSKIVANQQEFSKTIKPKLQALTAARQRGNLQRSTQLYEELLVDFEARKKSFTRNLQMIDQFIAELNVIKKTLYWHIKKAQKVLEGSRDRTEVVILHDIQFLQTRLRELNLTHEVASNLADTLLTLKQSIFSFGEISGRLETDRFVVHESQGMAAEVDSIAATVEKALERLQ